MVIMLRQRQRLWRGFMVFHWNVAVDNVMFHVDMIRYNPLYEHSNVTLPTWYMNCVHSTTWLITLHKYTLNLCIDTATTSRYMYCTIYNNVKSLSIHQDSASTIVLLTSYTVLQVLLGSLIPVDHQAL